MLTGSLMIGVASHNATSAAPPAFVPDFPFLYQLQNATYSSLLSTDFIVGVVDMDSAAMNSTQVNAVEAQGKTLFTYISIGEAEDYRSYWINGGWTANPPSFLLAENPEWPGNYYVKFWDAAWQAVMFDRVTEAVSLGYSGMYCDIVDGYLVPEVIAAYGGANIRTDMETFVIALSAHAKAINPSFKVLPQNAVELLATTAGPPNPNTTYLAAIDGIGVEDLWFDDNTVATWTPDDIEYIDLAVAANKFVLATSYPTDNAKQITFVDNAIAERYIPFIGNRALDGTIDATNLDTLAKMEGLDFDFPLT